MVRVGVLALQGGYEEHIPLLRRAAGEEGVSVETVLVRGEADLKALDAIVLPGGESTVIGRLAARIGLLDPLRDLVEAGLPVLATCAGAALLARRVKDRVVGEKGAPPGLRVMDVMLVRNYYGRQRESFEAPVEMTDPTGLAPELEEKPFPGVFIRAPAFTEAWGRAKINGYVEGVGAAAVQDAMVALAFHPELTSDTRLHRLLLRLARK